MDRAARVEPFTLLELTLRHSIVAVLSKPRWWTKWRDAEIRRKWLDEILQEFVLQTLEQSRKWKRNDDMLRALQSIIENESEERDAQLAAWFKHVRNNPRAKWPLEDEQDEEDGGLETEGDNADDEDEQDEEDSGLETESDDADDEDEFNPDDDYFENNMNAYVHIEWYFSRMVLREKCIPADGNWDLDRLRNEVRVAQERSDPTVAPRMLAFIYTVVASEVTEESVCGALQDIEMRAKRIADLHKHCKTIQQELASARSYISQVLDQIAASEHMLLEVASGDRVVDGEKAGDDQRTIATPTGVHGAWICDRLVPESVKTALVQEVAVLENVPEHAKDWHPNSNQQVLDLVHPSLFCCVFDTTKQVSSPADDLESFKDAAEHMRSIIGAASTLIKNTGLTEHSYQWIPSEFQVAEDGSVRILSYINNVHPEHHRELYGTIEAVFARFVPLFERTLSALTVTFPDPDFDAPHEYNYNEERPRFPEAVEIPFDMGTSAVSLRGKRLQVIVKAAEIVLTPEAPAYSGGSWHIEGTDEEQIVATGIYYFGCENIKDSRLSFRVNVDPPRYDQSDYSGVAVMFGLFNEDLLVQTLGSVSTIEDRCLVFPNVVQHKVEPFELEDRSKPGVRKILAFFLVDPEKTIPSTAVIPPQQREWVEEVQRPLLKRTKLVDSVQEIIKEMASGDTMTLEQAKAHRLELMSERSALSEPDSDDYGSYFSLCEH